MELPGAGCSYLESRGVSMADTEYENLLHPSMLQISYLLELEKIGKKRGSVALIADTCGVSHGPVSRFFKECIGRGYLTERYEFTDEGERALFIYKKILRDVQIYLKKMEIPETEIPEKTKQLVENVDYDLLRLMTRNAGQVKEQKNHTQSEDMGKYFLEKILDKGNFQVGIAIHQVSRNRETKLSMAHQGFEHLAYIRNNTRGSWLELTIREMHARSRIDGADMKGHLSSLKYENQGQLHQAAIKDGHLRIPLSACRFFRSRRGNVKGTVMITVTCSVGKAHMPESTALLTFWM